MLLYSAVGGEWWQKENGVVGLGQVSSKKTYHTVVLLCHVLHGMMMLLFRKSNSIRKVKLLLSLNGKWCTLIRINLGVEVSFNVCSLFNKG